MPAYVIFIQHRITDPAEFATYQAKARGASSDHPMTPLAVHGACETWEGEPAEEVTIVQFPTMEAARAFYNSPTYQEALPHRLRAADFQAMLVEGLQ